MKILLGAALLVLMNAAHAQLMEVPMAPKGTKSDSYTPLKVVGSKKDAPASPANKPAVTKTPAGLTPVPIASDGHKSSAYTPIKVMPDKTK